MLIYKVFVALHLQKPNSTLFDNSLPLLSDSFLTEDDLLTAKKKLTSIYRCFQTDVHESNLSKVNITEIQEAFDNFLLFCKEALQKKDCTPFLPIIFDYLEDNSLSYKATYSHIHIMYKLFCFSLKNQEDALDIAFLGQSFIESPKTTTAFLQWLRSRDVSIEQIMQTHILQNFFRYHSYTLSEPNNPVAMLGIFLRKSELTRDFSTYLSTTHCPEPSLSHYALDGTIHTADTLNNPIHIESSLNITATFTNMDSLFRVFGARFLTAILWWQTKTCEDKDVAIYLLNQPRLIKNNFSELIHSTQDADVLKKTLSDLLQETTYDLLVRERTKGILSLLPYSSYLANLIVKSDLTIYLQDINQRNASTFDNIADLTSLFNLFKKNQPTHAKLVLKQLISHMLKEPHSFNDEILIRDIRKFKPTKEEIYTRVRELEMILDDFVYKNSKYPIKDLDYISIEDLWRETFQKISMLQEIIQTPNHVPQDKYKLQQYIAHVLLEKESSIQVFNLDKFSKVLGYESTFDETQVTPYQRFLIEILSALDNEPLRNTIIQLLDESISVETEQNHRNWMSIKYDDLPLSFHACRNGNLGFMIWLTSNQKVSKKDIEPLVIQAAGLEHWHLVKYFHQNFNFKRSVINTLLALAIEQNNPEAVKLLLRYSKKSPDKKNIEQSFSSAIREKHLACVEVLLLCQTRPSDAVITKGYKQAIANSDFTIADLIAEYPAQKCLKDAINQTFINAARLDRLGIINHIRRINVNAPSQNTIDKALIAAVRAGKLQATRKIFYFNNYCKPEVLKLARLAAVKLQRYDILDFFKDIELVERLSIKVPTKNTKSPWKERRQSQAKSVPELSRSQSLGSLSQYGIFRLKSPTPSPVKKMSLVKPVMKRQISL
ncbi:MAG: hypothetical protein P1U74_04505 [Legionellaceae bacterium]|nr:hypothetical protein [Legionellaceae bacterium]